MYLPCLAQLATSPVRSPLVCLQVEAEVRAVNLDFVRLHGRSAAEAIDLFGRTHAVNATSEAKTDRMPTRTSGRSSLGPKLRLAARMAHFTWRTCRWCFHIAHDSMVSGFLELSLA